MSDLGEIAGSPLSKKQYGTINGAGPPIHMQTYTAGEDSSRLAERAKEFGLARQRQARQNVRERVPVPLSNLNAFVYQRMLDPGFADVRMRSVYTFHDGFRIDDEESDCLLMRPPDWREDSLSIEGPHDSGIGGDLVSAVLGIIKGMVGPAILYLPHGFSNAGLLCAIPILVVATALFLASSGCLLDSWKLESQKTNIDATSLETRHRQAGREILSYPELARRAFGSTGEVVVKVGIAAMQSGVCLTYLIFVPQNLSASARHLFQVEVPPSYFMIVMLAFQIPLSWIRNIRKLTVTNLFANILILYGLMTCLCFALGSAVKSVEGRGPISEITYKLMHLEAFRPGWNLFIGTSVLLFEGSITLLVPLQEAVYREEDRNRFPTVYRRVILGIISFYSFFGVFCWLSFGNDIRTVMTTSLPEGAVATTVQMAYSFAVIFTFPLQNFPSLEIACRSLATLIHKSCGKTPVQNRNFIASVLISLLAVVAIATMDNLDKVVSLMGSLLGCPLAFVIPPLIHNNLDDKISKGRRMKNLVVSCVGFCAMIFASITTVLQW